MKKLDKPEPAERAYPRSPGRVGDSYLSYFDMQAGILAACLQASRETPTVDAVHDLRVAVKRLRALFALSTSALEGFASDAAADALKRVFKPAGSLRDLHVQLDIARALSKAHALELSEYRNQLLAREPALRAKCQRKAVRFDMSAPAAWRDDLARALQATEDATVLSRARRIVGDKITALLALRGGAGTPEAELHRIRIRTKEARYALEILQGSFPGDGSLEQLNKTLRACHRALGLWHDHTVALDRVSPYLDTNAWPSLFKPDSYVAFAQILQSRREENLAHFASAWADLEGTAAGLVISSADY